MTQTTSADVRQYLIDALHLDLIGPTPDDLDHAEEELPQAPSKWYLAGFLVPYEADITQRVDDAANDELDQLGKKATGDDESTPEVASARKAFFPSSMGLSFLAPHTTQSVTVTVHWGDYCPVLDDEEEEHAETRLQSLTTKPWTRSPHQETLTLPLNWTRHSKDTTHTAEVPDSDGLQLVLTSRAVQASTCLPDGTRSVSIFLVNHRRPMPDRERDRAYIFQTQLSIDSADGFVPRPNPRGQTGDDWDEAVADLQYRHDYEYVVGHNVSAVAHLNPDNTCQRICTAWMPTADVEKVVAATVPGVELGMEAIARAPDADTVRAMIGGMVTAYAEWMTQQQANVPHDPDHPRRAAMAQELLHRAGVANRRIDAGLQALDDPQVLDAFQIANRAIATAIRQRWTHDDPDGRSPDDLAPPTWRPFQLAFLLMNIPSAADPHHPDREVVDLLFFPTGGGKTEAYLGLAAFTLVLRRLRNPAIDSAGVSVLMRYTLRLLTLDQLGRAATLICALEHERQQNVEKLGRWPFEIGLWVGQTATPNRMGKKGDNNPHSARSRTLAFQNDSKTKPSPIPLENCPWCGEKFSPTSFQLLPTSDQPTNLQVVCGNRKRRQDRTPQCIFRGDNPLPIVAVDEPIYRRLPCFIIATVDKFANLPWIGQTGALFGNVTHYSADGFYGPAEPIKLGRPLPHECLPPPDLIIQDELHLISGPLGTMVGLYETAIDALCSRDHNGTDHNSTHHNSTYHNGTYHSGKRIRPKIVASTATVRRATRQIQGLFGRNTVDVFPPPGPDRRDSFFAKTASVEECHPRTYVGIAAQGRSLKVVMLRTYLALLGAAQKQWEQAGGKKTDPNPADPYMTLLGYFNSLRELGGSRRIVEDEVNAQLTRYSQRHRQHELSGSFANRKIDDEPWELTSRVSTNQVADAKRRLAMTFSQKERVDVVLATNMISVGLDITRLGLMVVLGQPKTAAEYIQSTSRVGRDENRPGLVVSLLNIHRPRDRSHYERFQAWHTSFYRAVEATSVTPFSPRSVDRGLAGITVALARLGNPAMTAPLKAADIGQHYPDLDFVSEAIAYRAYGHDAELSEADAEALRQKIRSQVVDLLDAWRHIAADKGLLQYQQEEGSAPPLLFDFLDPEVQNQKPIAQKFKAQRSLRDVEPVVNLWVVNPNNMEAVEED